MPTRSARRSPLAMVLLVLLAEEPMHAYRMQQLIRERDKDSVVNVASRNSVYQALGRLQRAELVAVRGTSREQRRPERTVYQITEAGLVELHDWLAAMLAEPRNEFPEFPAALASMALLSPEQVTQHLERRAAALRQRLDAPDPAALAAQHGLARIFLVEDEYRRAMVEAELAWLTSVLQDLRTGALTWNRGGPSGLDGSTAASSS
ncbi:MAG: PadR family transcriptional regulator [Nocardioidaceae bacterium]